jgi:hypothetical protein
MEFFTVKEKEKIITIVKYLISEGVDVEVEIQGTDERFVTRAMAIKEVLEADRLIVEKLHPEEGNSLIQSAPEVIFSFDIKGRSATFATQYVGMHTEHPPYGLIAELPATIHLEEKRKEQRVSNGLKKILSVEFTMEDDNKQYQLNVVNIGASGIGFIVEKKDFDLFKKINVGNQIKNVTFFLPIATMTIDAMVKHMTLVKEGEFRGCYLVGIESSSLIEFKELIEEIEKMK